MNDHMRRDMTVGCFLWVNLCKGYCDSNKVVVTFWKFTRILVQNWELNLTWIIDTEMIVMTRVSCD
jgi:hypothetical protein